MTSRRRSAASARVASSSCLAKDNSSGRLAGPQRARGSGGLVRSGPGLVTSSVRHSGPAADTAASGSGAASELSQLGHSAPHRPTPGPAGSASAPRSYRPSSRPRSVATSTLLASASRCFSNNTDDGFSRSGMNKGKLPLRAVPNGYKFNDEPVTHELVLCTMLAYEYK